MMQPVAPSSSLQPMANGDGLVEAPNTTYFRQPENVRGGQVKVCHQKSQAFLDAQ